MVTTLFGDPAQYRKLCRVRIHALGSSRLLEAQDHLLQIEVKGFFENHRRFPFRDIKGIVIRRTATGKAIHLLLGLVVIPLVALIVWSLFSQSQILLGARWFLVALLVISVAWWVVHFLLGPTCSCNLMTAVQNERLGALSRLPQARRAAARIAERVTTWQGQTFETNLEHAAVHLAPTLVAPGAVLGQTAAAPPRDATWARTVALVLSISCLVQSAVVSAQLLSLHRALTTAESLVMLLLVGLSLVSVVGHRAAAGIRRLSWGILTFNVLNFLVASIYLAYLSMAGRLQASIWGYEPISPFSSPFVLTMDIVIATACLLFGATGLAMRYWGARGDAEPSRTAAGATAGSPSENEP